MAGDRGVMREAEGEQEGRTSKSRAGPESGHRCGRTLLRGHAGRLGGMGSREKEGSDVTSGIC